MQDELWKRVIEKLFPDFVAFFLPDLLPLVDFSKPYSFLDKELDKLFPESSSKSKRGRRHVDKLAKVCLKDGQEQWVLIHAEIQGYYDQAFEERMFTYFYRIFDKHKQKTAVIAVFADDRKDWKPQTFNYQFLQTRLCYEYPIYKILEQNEAALHASDNPFALVVLAALYVLRHRSQEEGSRLAFKLELMRLLLEKGYEKAKIEAVFLFVNTLIQIDDPLKQELFFEEAKKWR